MSQRSYKYSNFYDDICIIMAFQVIEVNQSSKMFFVYADITVAGWLLHLFSITDNSFKKLILKIIILIQFLMK